MSTKSGAQKPASAIDKVQLLKAVYAKYTEYASTLNQKPLSPHSVRAYKTRLQHFLGFLGEHLGEYSDALTNQDTRDYLARDYTQYLKRALKSSPQTVNSYLTAIDSFYSFLGLGKAKVAREDLPKLAPQALTAKEQKDFLRAVERSPQVRDRAIAILLINTGLRISECAALNLDDVLFTERKGVVKVRDGKGGAYREIPLNTQCREALQKWLEVRNKRIEVPDAFFISRRDTRISVDSIDHLIRKLAQQARLEGVSAHSLRHTCLTNLVRNGNDMVLVAQIGGHKKLETTMRYSLPTIFDQETAMEKIQIDY
jgi:site-specific recombinase XerD